MALKIDASTGPVIAALIAAVFGIFTAIYAGIASARNSRQLAALQAELDRHKQVTVEYLKAYLTLEIDERNRALEAFKEIIRSVQLLRDKTRHVLDFPHAYSPDILNTEIAELCRNISEAYASNQLFLPEETDRTLAHTLKNECFSAAGLLPQYVRHPEQVLKTELRELQRLITDGQLALRNRARQSVELVIAEAKAHVGQQGTDTHGK